MSIAIVLISQESNSESETAKCGNCAFCKVLAEVAPGDEIPEIIGCVCAHPTVKEESITDRMTDRDGFCGHYILKSDEHVAYDDTYDDIYDDIYSAICNAFMPSRRNSEIFKALYEMRNSESFVSFDDTIDPGSRVSCQSCRYILSVPFPDEKTNHFCDHPSIRKEPMSGRIIQGDISEEVCGRYERR